jgi:O-6-methylguanine DNA methyltransferase
MREYKSKTKNIIVTTTISTPIGEMFAAASQKGIVMLSFFTKYNIEAKIDTLKKEFDADVIPTTQSDYFDTLKTQLEEYFNGVRKEFDVPMQLVGSPFQVTAWRTLLSIEYGKTISYKEQAIMVKNEKSYRAVANANAQNMLHIIVPCHRVIGSDGGLNGYAGGIEKKEFLLKLEKGAV